MVNYYKFEILRRPSDELEMMLRSAVDDGPEDDEQFFEPDRHLKSDEDVLQALARHLRLNYAAGDNLLFVRMAPTILDGVELMFSRPNDRNSRKTLRATPAEALKGSTLNELLDLYADFKWRKTVIEGDIKLEDLARYLRDVAAGNLADRVDEMMARWEQAGLRAVAERHKPTSTPARPGPAAERPAADLRQRRRDNPVATYSPPSVPDAGRR